MNRTLILILVLVLGYFIGVKFPSYARIVGVS